MKVNRVAISDSFSTTLTSSEMKRRKPAFVDNLSKIYQHYIIGNMSETNIGNLSIVSEKFPKTFPIKMIVGKSSVSAGEFPTKYLSKIYDERVRQNLYEGFSSEIFDKVPTTVGPQVSDNQLRRKF